MNVSEIKAAVMFQTNNDAEDVGDFEPYLLGYINEGYDKLVYAYAGIHPAADYDTYHPFTADTDVPATPEWTHRALADYATWLVYRNGNTYKQNRGLRFLQAFDEVVAKVIATGGAQGTPRHFINIPT